MANLADCPDASAGEEIECLAFYGTQDYDAIKPYPRPAFETDRLVEVVGDTGQGKSTALIKLCASFASHTSFGDLFPNGYVPMIYLSGEQSTKKLEQPRSYISQLKSEAKRELKKKRYEKLEKLFEYFGDDKLPENRSVDNVLNFVKRKVNEVKSKFKWKEDKTVGVVIDNVETVFPNLTITSQSVMFKFWEKLKTWQRRENIVFICVMPIKTGGKKKNKEIEVGAVAGATCNKNYVGEIFAIDERRFYGVKNSKIDISLDNSINARYFLDSPDPNYNLFDDPEIRSIKKMKAKDLDALIRRKFGGDVNVRTIKESLERDEIIRRDTAKKTGKKCYSYSGCDCDVPWIDEDDF